MGSKTEASRRTPKGLGGRGEEGRAGDFAGEVGNGERGEVGEGKGFGGGEPGELRDASEEREDDDAVESDGVTRVGDGDEMEFGERGEELLSMMAEFEFSVLVNLNGGEMPHTGEKGGDVGAG